MAAERNDSRNFSEIQMLRPVASVSSLLARVTKVIFRNAAVGRRFTEPLRPSNLTRDVAHDVLSVPSGVQTGPYLSHDLACAPQAVSPGGHPNSANAQTCESLSRPKAEVA